MVDGLKPAFPFHFDIKFTKYLYSIMFLLPICLFYIYGNEPTAMILFSVIGMIGLYGLWSKMLVPFLDQYIMNHIDYSEKTVYIGFMRRDLVFMKKNLTELVFILDRSGSMQGLEGDTIGGFNAMIEKQKKEPGEVLVSTVLFDDQTEVLHDRVKLGEVLPITEKEYYVRGCTALLEELR